MANIDNVFNLTNQDGGYLVPQDMRDFNFAVMDDGPGGFTEYIMYRRPNSYGFGISPISKPYSDRLDRTHFNITYGKTKTGEISKEYQSFIDQIKTVEATGVNLVISNMGQLTREDYIVKLIVALNIIRIGGNFVCPVSNIMGITDLLYITNQCFDKITLFQPVSATPNTNYIIAQGAKENNIEWLNILSQPTDMKVKVPDEFVDWVKQFQYIPHITKYDDINIYKCKAIWNLPNI